LFFLEFSARPRYRWLEKIYLLELSRYVYRNADCQGG